MMLTQMTISNFAIVHELKIDFQQGMTAITGETGAGKSIAIDALGLCLGHRGEAEMVRQGADRADICAHFALKNSASAQHWLAKNNLNNGSECLLRRVINSDGRSRGFINGVAVPLSQLRELGQLLIQIHGQHAHQRLLKSEYQKSLLDVYANESLLLEDMEAHFRLWQQSKREWDQYQQWAEEREARVELLQYQLKELDAFAPQVGEYEKIDAQYKHLANSVQLLSVGQQTLQMLADDDNSNLNSLVHKARQKMHEMIAMDDSLSNVLNLLENAAIQISEASDELRHYCDHIELDSHHLLELEQRLSRMISLARKYHIAPEMLPEFHQQLLDEQQQLSHQESDQQALLDKVAEHHQAALACAQQLHQCRTNYAGDLCQLITTSMQALSMPQGKLVIDIQFNPAQLAADGADQIAFLISTNPGQPLQALAKVVSGGELSRIALAIQMITAQKKETPALVFDEVDVGISGPTAAVVGKILRQLGEHTQVVCITHLPQVAGCGHHHILVSKKIDDTTTETLIKPLNKRERLRELARLLGGSEVTPNTLANAKDLLAA